MSILEELRRNRLVFEALTGTADSGGTVMYDQASQWTRGLAAEPVSAPLGETRRLDVLEEVCRRDVEAGPSRPDSRAFSLNRAPVGMALDAGDLPTGGETVYPSGDRGPAAYGPGEVLLETLGRQLDTQARRQPQAIREEETL